MRAEAAHRSAASSAINIVEQRAVKQGSRVRTAIHGGRPVRQLRFRDPQDAAARPQPRGVRIVLDRPVDGIARQAAAGTQCRDPSVANAAEATLGGDPDSALAIEAQIGDAPGGQALFGCIALLHVTANEVRHASEQEAEPHAAALRICDHPGGGVLASKSLPGQRHDFPIRRDAKKARAAMGDPDVAACVFRHRVDVAVGNGGDRHESVFLQVARSACRRDPEATARVLQQGRALARKS